jgi:predicted AAA+ superfamily ATPase
MQAFLVYPIHKYTAPLHRTKKSTPKWLFPNPGLVHPAIIADPNSEGFVFENLIGSHLLNITYGRKRYELKYFRDDNYEVDFIFCKDGEPLLAIEVKSGRIKKIPTTSRLVQSGITCPLTVVNRDNVESFLEILDPDQLASWVPTVKSS